MLAKLVIVAVFNFFHALIWTYVTGRGLEE